MADSFSGIMEGQSLIRPPYFDGEHYNYWKIRMKNFLIANSYKLWMIVEEGMVLSTSEESKWTAKDIRAVQLNAKAKYALYCALSPFEFDKISSFETAKDIWNHLQAVYEGTSQVKETKINMLVHEFESFCMLDDEPISNMFSRFSSITNSLKALGQEISCSQQVKKILRSLTKEWLPKVIAIEEAKDLNKISLEELMGSLMAHEAWMEEKKKNLVFFKVEEEYTSKGEDEKDEKFVTSLTRRIGKLLKRKKKKTNVILEENYTCQEEKEEENKQKEEEAYYCISAFQDKPNKRLLDPG